MSEVLLVLRKGEDNTKSTVFLNLWEQPKSSLEALAIVRAIERDEPASLDESGMCEVNVGDKKYGEASQLSLKEHPNVPWAVPVSFAQTDLARVGVGISEGRFMLPGSSKVCRIRTVRLGDVAKLGPDGRDIYDGFALAKSRTAYPALWGHDAKEMSKLSQTSNEYLAPLARALSGRNLRDADLLWSRAGTLMLSKELWLNTNSVTGVLLPERALSNVWWPTRWKSSSETTRKLMERRLCLWFNSSLGLFTMVMQRQETRGAWVKFPKAWYEDLNVTDLSNLNEAQEEALDEVWKKVNGKDLKPFPEMAEDKVRKELDDGIAEALELPSLGPLRSLLAREPFISLDSSSLD